MNAREFRTKHPEDHEQLLHELSNLAANDNTAFVKDGLLTLLGEWRACIERRQFGTTHNPSRGTRPKWQRELEKVKCLESLVGFVL